MPLGLNKFLHDYYEETERIKNRYKLNDVQIKNKNLKLLY